MPESNHPFLVSTSKEEEPNKKETENPYSERETLHYKDLLSLLELTEEWLQGPGPENCNLPANLKILNHNQLINLINLKNFFEKDVFLVFSHPRYKQLLRSRFNPPPSITIASIAS